MAVNKGGFDVKAGLDKAMPMAAKAKLGTTLDDVINAINALAAKLDNDAGVTDTNYAATIALKALGAR